jgi:hypothetical protein
VFIRYSAVVTSGRFITIVLLTTQLLTFVHSTSVVESPRYHNHHESSFASTSRRLFSAHLHHSSSAAPAPNEPASSTDPDNQTGSVHIRRQWPSSRPLSSTVFELNRSTMAPVVLLVSNESASSSLGAIRDSLSTVVPMTVLYVLILVTGVLGNVGTCLVIWRNKHMRTATNYYLFSLAVSDLSLLLFGLPQDLYQLWRRYPYVFGELFCVMRGFSSEASSNASVLTITAFTVER